MVDRADQNRMRNKQCADPDIFNDVTIGVNSACGFLAAEGCYRAWRASIVVSVLSVPVVLVYFWTLC